MSSLDLKPSFCSTAISTASPWHVPARLALDVVPGHRLVAREHVLEDACEHVVRAGIAVGGRRALVEHERRRPLAVAQRGLEDVALAPAGEHLLLQGREGDARRQGLVHGTHRERRILGSRLSGSGGARGAAPWSARAPSPSTRARGGAAPGHAASAPRRRPRSRSALRASRVITRPITTKRTSSAAADRVQQRAVGVLLRLDRRGRLGRRGLRRRRLRERAERAARRPAGRARPGPAARGRARSEV